MSHALLSIAFHEYALAGLAYLAYLVRQWKLLPLIGRALVGSGLVLHAIALAAQGVPQGMAQGLSALAFLLLFILLALDLRYRSEEHTSELQSHLNLVCRLLLEKK